MDIGVHLPLIAFGDDELSLGRLERAADAAVGCGLAALAANDHFVFATPWLDGPTALAASKRGQRSSNGMPSAS